MCLLFALPRRPPRPARFPYTTLFRSVPAAPTEQSWTSSRLLRIQADLTHDLDDLGLRIGEHVHQRDLTGDRIGHPVPDQVLHSLRSEEHTSELQSRGHLVCRLLLEKKTIMDINK